MGTDAPVRCSCHVLECTTVAGQFGRPGRWPVDDDFAAVRRAATLAGLHQTQ
jgi:hypothetical protein